ncbi:MAG TPA: MlaD family protein [Gemmatimonadaceae bacterium]|nr:MlaD family protein [Gemmatimonadaceae bacterium]
MRRRNEVLVGVVVLVALILGIFGTLWLVRGGLASGYPLYARFPWGSGLKQGQPVLLSGVNVGYVGDIDLQQDGTVTVTLRILGDYKVPDGSIATVEPNGFFGDMMVALRPSAPNLVSYPPGDTIPTGKPSVSMADILARLDTVGRSVREVSDAFQIEMVQRRGIADLRATLEQSARFMTQLNAIAAQQSLEISRTTAALRRTAGAIDSASVDSTVRNLQATSANMAALSADLRKTNEQLTLVVAKLNNGEGTAGKLLTDTLLYRDVRNLVGRIDSLTADFKRNPRRYINLEIF